MNLVSPLRDQVAWTSSTTSWSSRHLSEKDMSVKHFIRGFTSPAPFREARGLTQTQSGMQLEEGPVLLIAAVSRLDQQVTHLSGRGSWRNPHWPAVAVLSVYFYQLHKQEYQQQSYSIIQPNFFFFCKSLIHLNESNLYVMYLCDHHSVLKCFQHVYST